MFTMIRNRTIGTSVMCAALCALLAGAATDTALAQQQDDGRDYRNQDRQSDRQSYHDDMSSRRDRQRFQGRQRGSRMGQRQGQRDPAQWTFIAYDIDGDRYFDAYEYILVKDLETARQSTRRSMGYRQGQGQGNFRQRAGGARGFRMQGDLRDLKTVNLVGMDQPHRIGKIDTQHGTVKVDLGPTNQLNKLNLSEGDRVTVFGREGRINDRRMLIATSVQSGGQKATLRRDRFNTQRKLEGKVVTIRNASFRQSDQDHRIARVRTRRGNIVPVDLGSRQMAGKLNVSEGDNITVIGQRGRINGKSALFAHQVRVNGGSIHQLSRADDMSRRRRTQSATGK